MSRRNFVPTLSVYSERRSEYKAFLRTAPVGTALTLNRNMPFRTHNVGYSIELGRTEAQPPNVDNADHTDNISKDPASL